MKALILTSGSQGDIQPYLALAQTLQARGHDVRVAAPDNFASFAAEHGVPFFGVDDSILALKDTSAGEGMLEGKANPLKLMKLVKPMMRQMLNDYWASADGFDPDVVIYHPKTLAGYSIAEKLGVPPVLTMPLPMMTPTSAFPVPIAPPLPLGGVYNRITHQMIGLLSAGYMGIVNGWRKDQLGLPSRGMMNNENVSPDGRPTLTLYAYSDQIVPKPADWGANVHVTGYWERQPDTSWQPPTALLDFLNAGPAPVYIGFGSMFGKDSERRGRVILDALEQSGQRAILATGWGGLKVDTPAENVFVVEQAPHEWLFNCVSAVVHHGGAGTTAAGLRAGKPTLICPFMGDQGFWGHRVEALGVGAAPIAQKALTADKLAAALKQITTDNGMRERAETLGLRLRAENGAVRAAEILEREIR